MAVLRVVGLFASTLTAGLCQEQLLRGARGQPGAAAPSATCPAVCAAEGFSSSDCSCDDHGDWAQWICETKGGVQQSKPWFCSQPGCSCNQWDDGHGANSTELRQDATGLSVPSSIAPARGAPSEPGAGLAACSSVCYGAGMVKGDCSCDDHGTWAQWVCDTRGGVPQSPPIVCSQPGCDCHQQEGGPSSSCPQVCSSSGFVKGDCTCQNTGSWSMWVCSKRGGVPQDSPWFCSQPDCRCNQ
mmetsp:Transcript_116695/g.362576  ORF Transcript_116695/g.362576 Transcript_116695/m.362576 type:complete len:242 (-) Transcript_116695:17-742(-)